MERRGLGAMAARNLALSLLHDITPAGRGWAAPSAGRATQGEGSWSRLQNQPPPPQQSRSASAAPSKERPPPERQVHSDTRPFGFQALPQPRFPRQKMLRTSLILIPRGTGHAGSPSWASTCWWHHVVPSPAAEASLSPRRSRGPRGV